MGTEGMGRAGSTRLLLVLFRYGGDVVRVPPRARRVRGGPPSAESMAFRPFTIPLLVPSRSQFWLENRRSPVPRGRDRRLATSSLSLL